MLLSSARARTAISRCNRGGTLRLNLPEYNFTKFLFFQRARHRRTIFLIEETRDNGGWVRDKVRHLVALETAGKFGLMAVLFRQSSLRARLDGRALNRDTAPATTELAKQPLRLFAITPIIQPSGAAVGSMSVDLTFKPGSRRRRPALTTCGGLHGRA
jgi:hypothetical protein